MPEPTLLVVDDVPENLGILFGLLTRSGYKILVAEEGAEALRIAHSHLPDLILLDVMMDEPDGFETCRQLKKAEDTRDIPVIFMTALSDASNKVTGFQLGAVDYITKPFHQEEVLARIETHLTIHRLQAELQQNNDALLDRNAQLDAFAHTVAHDLKNPLSTIASISSLLIGLYQDQFAPEHAELLHELYTKSMKASDIIESLLLLANTSHHKILYLDNVDMAMVFRKAQEQLQDLLDQYEAELVVPEQWPFAVGYPGWLEEVWVNYLSNALKYGGEPPEVEVGATREGEWVRFWVKDNGPGLSREQQAKLFTPFTRLHLDRADGHGLGLTIVQNIITKLGGQAGVESESGQGCTFYFTLRAHAQEMDTCADSNSEPDRL